MRIAFDFYGIGLGNNGGTRTCVLSANTLVDQGHKVFLFSNMGNRYNWSELKAEYIEGRGNGYFPSVDVLIATGAKTSFHTQGFDRKKLGVYWIRGIETWSNSVETLVKSYRLPLLKMTNSEWQRDYVLQHTFREDPVHIQYPGLEVDFFTPEEGMGILGDLSLGNPVLKIGGLLHPATHKGARVFLDIVKNFPESKIKILTSSSLTIEDADWDIVMNPSEENKRAFYRSCDVWLATTKLDGLHLPPMEAGLCGVPLVCSANPMSGMLDHAIHRETALTFLSQAEAVGYIKELEEHPEYGRELNERHRELLVEKMGSRELQMKKMVSLFEENL